MSAYLVNHHFLNDDNLVLETYPSGNCRNLICYRLYFDQCVYPDCSTVRNTLAVEFFYDAYDALAAHGNRLQQICSGDKYYLEHPSPIYWLPAKIENVFRIDKEDELVIQY
jgi:hypothetical protein